MTRPINFGAGPAAIPAQVLTTIRQELFNWEDTGLSILETGHRAKQFSALGEKIEAQVRKILKVPPEFSILFLPGGGQVQFAMATMNLAKGFKVANFVETGHWSTIAMKEANKYLKTHLVASSKNQNFTTIPERESWDIQKEAAFLHFTDNETIGGVEFSQIPLVDDMVLVSDMSSNIFSRSIDFTRLGCIYACAQKNLGVAGMSLVIVRRDLLDRALPETPVVYHYATQDQNRSLYCTPTTFSWYVASLILDWIEEEGGLEEMSARSHQKSQLLYSFIDTSEFYQNPIDKRFRSRMNIPFLFTNSAFESEFFKLARLNGLVNLEGHRSVGAARASIYNAISVEDVKKLVDFMKFFASQMSHEAQHAK